MSGSAAVEFDEFRTIILNIEQNLYLPSKLEFFDQKNFKSSEIDNQKSALFEIIYDIVSKPILLQCGCIISSNIRVQYYQDDKIFNILQQRCHSYSEQFFVNNVNYEASNEEKEKNIYKIKMNFDNHNDICPICYQVTDLMSGRSVKPLIQLHNQLQFLKNKYFDCKNEAKEVDKTESFDRDLKHAFKHRKRVIEADYNIALTKDKLEINKSSTGNFKPQSLLHLFQTISMQINDENLNDQHVSINETDSISDRMNTTSFNDKSSEYLLLNESERNKQVDSSNFEFNLPILNIFENSNHLVENISESNKSNQSASSTITKAKKIFLSHNNNISIKNNYPIEITEDEENKEIFYSKCFPMYRKRSQFNVHSNFFVTKTKLYINMDISTDCRKFVLLSDNKWEVYDLFDSIDTKKNDQPFRLLCCGRINGAYGKNFNELKKIIDEESVKPDESYKIPDTGLHKKSNKLNNVNKVNEWDYLFCKIMNNFLIIAGTKGVLRIMDLNQNGKTIKTLKYSFPIRCIDVDCIKNQIACGITGKDRTSGAEQALIVFQKIYILGNGIPTFPPPITITLPYRDPINTLQFSDDGRYLSCSTCFENRFLIISLKKIDEPRLIMKSIRNIDNSLESEGITSTHIFPGNSGLMCVTSVAHNSPPIILDTKIKTFGKSTSNEQHNNKNNKSSAVKQVNKNLAKDSKTNVLQPSMLLRLDEMGSKIYKCEISPRNDSVAFLDKNGTVYLMASSTNSFDDNNEKKRILILDNVSNAYKLRESAIMKFNKNGHKLYILDRKGILYIEDFSAGLPQDKIVSKCKQIN
ncbi:hypothetical protein QEN19_001335 [Hanseniaspora menglaensis]